VALASPETNSVPEFGEGKGQPTVRSRAPLDSDQIADVRNTRSAGLDELVVVKLIENFATTDNAPATSPTITRTLAVLPESARICASLANGKAPETNQRGGACLTSRHGRGIRDHHRISAASGVTIQCCTGNVRANPVGDTNHAAERPGLRVATRLIRATLRRSRGQRRRRHCSRKVDVVTLTAPIREQLEESADFVAKNLVRKCVSRKP